MSAKFCYYCSIVATVVLIAAMVGLYQLHALFSDLPQVLVLQSVAVILMGWARLSFGRRSFYFAADSQAEKLVTQGAYQFMRHPIYTAIGLFAGAGVAAHFSVLNAILAGLVLLALLARVVCEEFCLQKQFPEYADYAKRTARFIPFVF
jgi:protein-S-isoprenylcysteine O-methyltransferase Ste14